MSEYDELRRAFDDLAAGPPLALGRKEAVMSRVTRRLQRQALVRGAGVLALAVALGTTAVQTSLHLQQTGSDGEATVITTGTPSAEPSHSPSEHPASTEPTHGPGSTEPSHAPSTEPSHEPSSEPTHAPGSTEPTHAPSTEPSHEPTSTGPSPENTAASGPLTVSVSMSPSTVDTGTDTHALVTARDGEGRLLAVDIDWGDGKTFHFSPGDVACPRTTHLDGSFNHRYASPGSYAVHVTVTTGDCAPTEKVTKEAHVTVTGSEPTSSPTSTNGPSEPTAGATSRTGDNAAYTYLNASGGDADGWVKRITINWGDGTGTTTVGEWSTSSCANASGSDHPAATHHDGNVNHHYESAGSHTVTITTYSVACDGSSQQVGSSTVTVTS